MWLRLDVSILWTNVDEGCPRPRWSKGARVCNHHPIGAPPVEAARFFGTIVGTWLCAGRLKSEKD